MEQKVRQTVDQISMTPAGMQALQGMILQRLANFGVAVKSGARPMDCLMAEIVTVEVKLDALLHLLEKNEDVDFTNLPQQIEISAKQGHQNAIMIGEHMAKTGQKRVQIVQDESKK